MTDDERGDTSEGSNNDLQPGLESAVRSLFGEVRAHLERLNEECAGHLEGIERVRERTATAIDSIMKMNPVVGQIDELTERIERESERLEEASDEIRDRLDELTEDFEESVDSAGEDLEKECNEQAAIVNSFLVETTDTVLSRTEALVTKVQALRGRLSDKLDAFLGRDIEDAAKEHAGPYIDRVDALHRNGLSKIRGLNDQFEKVEETSRALTDLINDVKPVLDLVRQVL